jgi:hypothetical protein
MKLLILLTGIWIASAFSMAEGAAVSPGECMRPNVPSSLKVPVTRHKILEEIREIEFNEIQYDTERKEYFNFIEGKIPILISAPHGAKHFRRREGRWKGEDEYTSALAIKLGRMTGAHVIYLRNKAAEDPNHDPDCSYKRAVEKAVRKYGIKFLLDLHGAHQDRPFKVDIGILHEREDRSSCPTFKEILRKNFSDFGKKIFNQRFTANDCGTMTSFAKRRLGIEAAQFEINGRYRIVDRKPVRTGAAKEREAAYRADEEDVLLMITRLENTIQDIRRRIDREASSSPGPRALHSAKSSVPGGRHLPSE